MFSRPRFLILAAWVVALVSGCARESQPDTTLSVPALQQYFSEHLTSYGEALAAIQLPPLTANADDPDYFGFRIAYFPTTSSRFAILTIERKAGHISQHNLIATRQDDTAVVDREIQFDSTEATLDRLVSDLDSIDFWNLGPYTTYVGSGGRLIWVEAVSGDKSILTMRWAPDDGQMTLVSLQKPFMLFSRLLEEYGINEMWRQAAQPSPQ